jgi:predicted DNA-binding transcriptional regulator YafY
MIRSITVEGTFVRPRRFELGVYWTESTERFERELYRGTALVRVTARGRTLLGNGAAMKDAFAAAVPDPRDGWLRVELPIESITHATGQLLGLGDEVEVLAPAELRRRIRDTARAIAARHTRPASPPGRPARKAVPIP